MDIFTIIWASWFISEILLSRLSRSKSPGSKRRDKNSLRLMWITIIISITLGVLMMIYIPLPISASTITGYIGLILIVCGVLIRFVAIRTLGNFFTVNLAIHDDHRIVNTGLYKYIRHPSYTGSLLSFIGLGVSFNNWISLCVIIIPVLFSFIYRINVEEKLMLRQFGLEYVKYMKSTKRLIPLIY
ncbi:MAG: isoprenylcysteine carboxylmethyltransferase family protein [Bacteroidia bacterium]|nr:MAG: isoprenylcysteine carboxylmethyltransferase family protein [Bacteroidia bacterium]